MTVSIVARFQGETLKPLKISASHAKAIRFLSSETAFVICARRSGPKMCMAQQALTDVVEDLY